MDDPTFSLSSPDLNLYSGPSCDIRPNFYSVEILSIIGDTEWSKALVEGALLTFLRSEVGKDLIFL